MYEPLVVLRKILKKAILFSTLLCLTSFVACFSLDTLCKMRSVGYYSFLSVVDKRPDIVILGASRALHHYNAPFIKEKMEKTTYNFGVGGTSVLVQYSQLKQIISHYKPKLVVYEVIGGDFSESYMLENLAYLKLFPDNKFLKHARAQNDEMDWIRSIVTLYKYNGICLSTIMDMALPPHPDKMHGYRPVKDAKLDVILKNPPYQGTTKSSYLRSKLLETTFTEFLNLAHQNNLNLVFLRSPLYDKTGSGYPQDDKSVQNLILKYGYKYYDFSNPDEPSFKDTGNYHDYVHLTDNGATLYTKKILPILRDYFGNTRHNP